MKISQFYKSHVIHKHRAFLYRFDCFRPGHTFVPVKVQNHAHNNSFVFILDNIYNCKVCLRAHPPQERIISPFAHFNIIYSIDSWGFDILVHLIFCFPNLTSQIYIMSSESFDSGQHILIFLFFCVTSNYQFSSSIIR